MRRRGLSIKALLIALLTAKLGVTAAYLTGTVSISELLLSHPQAIAQEKPAPDQQSKSTDAQTALKPKSASEVDVSAVLNRLNRDRKQMEREKENLSKQRHQLEALKQEIEEKIEKLSKIQQQIAADIAKREAMDNKQDQVQQAEEDEKMKMLGKVYSSMKPKQAAAIINKMDLDVIQRVFSQMKGEQIGNILSYVDQERAALISERLADKNGAKAN